MPVNLEAFKHYYTFSPGVRGIDLSHLVTDVNYSRPYFTETGQSILVTIRPAVVEIIENTPRRFPYGLSGRMTEGEVDFHVYTRDTWGVPFPDLFAGAFIRSMLRYFPDNEGVVTSWFSGWNRGSVNYESYQESIGNGMSFDQAAWSTWSGRLAQSQGFSRLESVPEAEALVANVDMAVRFYP
jgi:hypothetical protein